MDQEEKTTLMTFPCEYTFKVFGLSDSEFERNVLQIVHDHFPTLKENALSYRKSQQGKYLALSITVIAQRQEDIDAVYQQFKITPEVILSL